MTAITNTSVPSSAKTVTVFGRLKNSRGLWAYLLLTFLGTGLLFGNLNAIVMEPLGHIAGMGSAVSSGLQMLISLPLGTLIGRAYDGTVFPAVAGFALLSSAALAAMWWAEGGRARAIQAPLGETRTHS